MANNQICDRLSGLWGLWGGRRALDWVAIVLFHQDLWRAPLLDPTGSRPGAGLIPSTSHQVEPPGGKHSDSKSSKTFWAAPCRASEKSPPQPRFNGTFKDDSGSWLMYHGHVWRLNSHASMNARRTVNYS